MEQGNGKTRKRRLSAEEKWQIYQECEQPGSKVGEILRKYRLYSSDLQNIRRDVRDGALERLRQSRPGRKKVMAVPRGEHEQLKQDLAEKEKALVELSVLFTALKKKSELGISGPFAAGRLPFEVRQEIVGVIKASGEAGIGKLKSCELLQIHIRRIERWESRLKSTGTLQYGKSGPKQALHAIVPAEREAVLCFARRETTVDYSFQMLSIRGAEQGLFFMSASSVRHILQEYGLGDDRSGRRRGTKGLKPNRPEELTGPNQCWCWDISYLRTDIRRVFWYLYVLLDEWSRKVIAWRVSHPLSHEEAMGLIDDGIIAEKLLDVPQEQRPVVVNDHGSQMKAKPVKQMFVDLGIEQTFARCKTPNDNPFIEALFSTVKTSPAYPGWFPSGSVVPVREYFTRFFNWYDNEHYHSRIGYVTPLQKHTGQAERILTERKEQLTARRQERTKYWLSQPLTGSGL